MAPASKTSLDPILFCREVQTRFGPEHAFSLIAGKIINDCQARNSASDAGAFERIGAEIQRETLQLVNAVKAALASKEFQEVVVRAQRRASDAHLTAPAAAINPATSNPARRGGQRGAQPAATRISQALGSRRASPATLAQATQLVESWVSQFVRRAKAFSDWRVSEFVPEQLDTQTEEYLFRKEELAAMYPQRLAGADGRPQMRAEDLQAGLQSEGRNFLRTSFMLKKLALKDLLSALKDDEDLPLDVAIKYTALLAGKVAEAEFKNRLPGLAYSLFCFTSTTPTTTTTTTTTTTNTTTT